MAKNSVGAGRSLLAGLADALALAVLVAGPCGGGGGSLSTWGEIKAMFR